MMPARADLKGLVFGRWYVMEPLPGAWACKCECGTWGRVKTYDLTRGLSKSCGCLQRELLSAFRREKSARGGRLAMLNLKIADLEQECAKLRAQLKGVNV